VSILYLKDSNLSKDMAMFNQEIGRLTKERDTAKTELEVRVHCKKGYRFSRTERRESTL
jgi:hypothetical protein